ncbi:diaminopimelate decarboxylase [Rickettsiales endosymbiont of Trichoplax sp. H2]|uniref:diaminopimelate decarboxylase n=1 Tax=Rickettsiales endosymbiont of Trichoplax sp. H2 TaxID=2021221 RepID=UPI0012B23DBC|nr:diaminopimelate decarboxylase [Rickettsiales endosymbiont of Trichoplax sp. H2]MSO14288.1 Diaminopimelate decarboxylase [Rickettsiales endosymbiont of Trichoplax sp. H2]
MLPIDYFVKNQKLISNIITEVGTPVFITDKSILNKKVKNIRKAFDNNCLLYYALKANFNPMIIRLLKDAGIDGVETISPFEIDLAKKCGFQGNQILFTGNNCDNYELDYANKHNVVVNIGSISELQCYAEKYNGSEVSIRINPGFGDGEFKQIITGGEDSKFGIYHSQMEEALNIIKFNNLKLIGLHCHLGSGLYNTMNFAPMVDFMFKLGNQIENLRFIDLGGGFGVRYKPSDEEVDLSEFALVVDKYYKKYQNLQKNNIKIVFEPGKYLVAESTFLLTKITNIRLQGNKKIVCVNTGFNHIIRPALYSSYHHVINLSNTGDLEEEVQLVGNICESTDIINNNIQVIKPEEGNILAILTAGAYCSSMSSLYNLRPYASEVLIDDINFKITRRRMDFEDTFNSMGFNY